MRLALCFLAALTAPVVSGQQTISHGTNYPVNLPVPDGNPGGITSTRVVSSPIGLLTDLNVTLRLANGWNGDLYVFLAHDSGFSVLLNRAGRRAGDAFGYGEPGMDVTFDDGAASGDIHVYRLTLSGSHTTPLGGGLTGVWAPDGRATDPSVVLDTDARTELLASFNGLNPNGEWTLFLADLESGDQTTLLSWGLELSGNLPVPPSFTTPPMSQTAECPGNLVLTAAASGTGPLTNQWYRNGAAIIGAANSTLALTNLHPSDSGNFTLGVCNMAGCVTSAPAVVTIQDTIAPLITVCASNLAICANLSGQALLPSLTSQIVASDLCSLVTVTQSPAAGTNLSLGTHVVTFTATDATGNSASCTATVTIGETVPPSILCPPNITRKITNATSAIVAFAPSASDNCGVVNITCQPASGSSLPIGTNSVTCVATDGSGNSNTCSFLVTVFPGGGTNFLVNLPVPDGNSGGMTITRVVSTPVGLLTDLNVLLRLTNGWNGDLYAYLVHDSGYSVLLNRAGRRADDAVGYGDPSLEVTFDDSAAVGDIHVYRFTLSGSHTTPLGGGLTGVWAPDGRATDPAVVLDTDARTELLASFNGLNPNGEWTLFLADLDAGHQTTLVSWGLEFCGYPAIPPSITSPPGNRTVFQGDAHSFTVAASGTSPFGYQWLRGGMVLAGQTNSTLSLLNIQTNEAGFYAAIVVNVAGSITSAPARLTVRGVNAPRYPTPQTGWAYLYEGNAASNSLTASLDGTWNHNNGSDSWDGLGRGAGNGLLGGVEATNGFLTVEDAIGSNDATAGNRRYYFMRDLGQDTPVTNAASLLNDGVTLTFRARLTPADDPRLELTNAPNGWVNANGGKGIFGLRQGRDTNIISFSLNKAVEDTATNTTFNFGQAGLHMNNLNGATRTSFVNPGDPIGTVNLLPLDPTVFHEFWITIKDNEAAPGTHAVTIYRDGSRTGVVFNVTAGSGSDGDFASYLAMGMGSGPQRGAVDVDFFGYAPGVLAPPAFNEPVGFVFQPTNIVRAIGQFATFNVGVTGTPQHSLQWYRNGSAIAGATNSTYTTPAVTLGDDGTPFTVVAMNDVNAVTSSPPAVLNLLRPPEITVQPQNFLATNGDTATFSVTVFSPLPPSFQWRFNGAAVPGANASGLSLSSVSIANAGSYDVIITNAGGAITSLVASLTVRVLDFGDAPDPTFPTLKASNGARHVVVPGIHLGLLIDVEVDAAPNASATGDDTTGTDDEDGVTFLSPLRAGQLATVEVIASTNGFLNAWLDFNRNGGWAQAGEQIFTNRVLVAGTNTLSFLVAPSASGGDVFARFRFSTAGGLSFNGPAADGEVEDYRITLVPVADLLVTQSDSPDPVAVGSNLTYTITVSNAGPSPASGIAFTNILPAGTTFVSATPSQGSCNRTGGEVACALNGLASGASALVTIRVINSAVGTLTNRGSALAAELDLSPGNNQSTEITTVLGPPQITAQPQSLTVTNGATATFSVAASGAPPLLYQWRVNGNDLTGETNATLIIPGTQPASAGSYSVRVSNAVGAQDSLPATLTVLVPPSIGMSPQSRTNLAGSTASFSVGAAGTEPLRYQWFFQSTNVLAGSTNATLTLVNAQSSQAGDYRVRVTNTAGVVTSANATLTVIEMDFGDAPDPTFPTLLVNDGARHRILPGVRLGALIDFEPDGQPNSAATGDGSDEDGVAFLSPVLVGQVVNLSVVASTNGLLSAWLDFNRNGSWAEAGEQIFTNMLLAPGANLIQFRVPLDAALGDTQARFRFSTAGGLSFVGEAADGEVEDYSVAIGAAVDLATTASAPSGPVVVGSNVTFTLQVTNAGPSVATGVTLSHELPAGLSFVSAGSTQGGCGHVESTITCALGLLTSNAFAEVTIEAAVTGDGSLVNAASASAAESDINLTNNTAQIILRSFFLPAITTQPADRTVTEGAATMFSVATAGTALHYQWTRDNVALPHATNATFALAATSTNDAGLYRVLVTNEVGLVLSSSAALIVRVPATILVHPQDLDRLVGDAAIFAVSALGSAPLSYQWLIGGFDIPGETNATLTLLDIQPSHAGLYSVRVENPLRSITSSEARLTVFAPPAFTAQPQSRTNFAGGTAVMTAALTGTAPLSHQWLFNDAPISAPNDASLMLTNLQPSQSGAYTLVVTNFGGAATSAVAMLTVIEADFGDAPESLGYPTRLVFNGAWHQIVSGVRLGLNIDYEPDGRPDEASLGDDLGGTDDEDGVEFLTPLFLGHTAAVAVTVSANGFIDAWLDFGANGSWFEVGEQIFTSQTVTAGVNILTFPIPSDAQLTNTFARFRFSTLGGLSAEGPASDGEVEDYLVTILPSFDLAVTLEDGPDPVFVGGNLIYTITVTNRGPSLASDVMLTNLLPSGMAFLSVTATQGGCTNQAGLVRCALGSIAPGTAAQVLVELQTSRAGRVSTSVGIGAIGDDVNPLNNSATQTTDVVTEPAVFSDATAIYVADADVNGPGLASLYPAVISVSGLTGAVFKVTVTLLNVSHTFPGDFDILLVGPSGQKTILMSDAGRDVDMEDVTVTFDDDAGVSLPNSGIITSSAYRPTDFSGSEDVFPPPAPSGPYGVALSVFRGTDPNGNWSLYMVDDGVNDLGAIAGGWQLDITTGDPIADTAVTIVVAPNLIGVESNLTFTATATNPGPAAATRLRLTGAIPARATFVGASLPGGSCMADAGVVRCELGILESLSAVSATIILRADVPGPLSFTAAVSADQLDLNPSNNVATVSASVLPVNDLVLAMSASTNRVVLGQSLSYLLTVTNRGPANAAHVVLIDTLPSAVNVVAITSAEAACMNVGQTVFCDFGPLPTGGGGMIQIVVEPRSVGFVTNFAGLASEEIDSSAPDNTAQIITPVNLAADLAVGAIATPNPVAATSNLTLHVGVTNFGPSAANGVRLITPLPLGSLFINAASTLGGCTNDAGTLTCSLGSMAVGQDAVVTFVFAPQSPGSLTNLLLLASDSFDFAAGDNSSILVTSVELPPDITTAPTNRTVLNGANVTFFVVAIGYAPLRYQWQLDGGDVPNATNSSLTLNGVTPAGQGAYRVRVANPVGAIISSAAVLRVLVPPTISDVVDVTVDEDNATPVMAFLVGDFETPAGALVVTAASSNPQLVPLANILLDGAGSNRTVQVLPATNESGSATITLELRDTDEVVALDTFVVTVRPVNDLPYLSPIAAQLTDEDVAIAVPLTISDAENTTAELVITVVSSNSNLVRDSGMSLSGSGSNRVLNILPLTNQFGTAAITLTVTDTNGASVSNTFVLTVVPVNDPPTLNPIANLVIDEDAGPQVVNFSGLSRGVQNEPVLWTFSATSSDTGIIPHGTVSHTNGLTTGVIHFTPAPNASGVVVFTMTANDGGTSNNLVTRSFTVTINPLNDPPSLTDISNQSTLEDTPVLINYTIGDQESSATNLTVTASSSNTNLVPTANITFAGAGAARQLLVRLGTNQSGSATVTVTVTDPQGASASDSFLFVVYPVNDAPTLAAIADLEVVENSGPHLVTLTGISSGADDEEQDLQVTVLSSNPALILPILSYASPGALGTLTFTPAASSTGSVVITVTVNDGGGINASVSRNFSVNVIAVDYPPTLSALASLTTREDEIVSVAFSVDDAETPLANLLVIASSSDTNLVPPSALSITGTGAVRLLHLAPATNRSGVATITLSVTDTNGGSAVGSFAFTIQPVNDPPSLSGLANFATREDLLVTLPGIVIQDVDSDVLAVALTARSSDTNLIPNANIVFTGSGSNRTATITPSPDQSGSAVVMVTATDPEGAATAASFTVTVAAVNDSPALAAIGNVTVNKNAGTRTVPLSGLSSGPANEQQILTFSLGSGNALLITNLSVAYVHPQTTGVLSFATVPGASGSALLSVTVNDGGTSNNVVTRTFTVTVNPVDDPPTLSLIADVATREDTARTIAFTIADDSTPLASLALAASSSNTNLLPASRITFGGSGASRTVTILPATNQFGSATVTITVTDTSSNSVSRAFVLMVESLNDLPALSAMADQSVNEDTNGLIVAFSASDVETPASNLVVTAQSSNLVLVPAAGITLGGTGTNRTLTIVPAPEQSGVTLITVTVTDADGGATTKTFTLTVVPVNDPPTMAPIGNVTVNQNSGMQTVALSGLSAGPANELQFLTFSLVSSDALLITNLSVACFHPQTTGVLSFAIVPDASGTATISVTANDGAPSNNIVSRSFTVTVAPIDYPPAISFLAGNSTPEDTARNLSFTVSDDRTPAANLVLTAASSNTNLLPLSGITFGGSGSNRTVTLLPATNQSGLATITLTVTDTNSNSSSRAFVLTVDPVNDAPVISAIANQTANEDTNGLIVAFTVSDLETLPSSLVVTARSSNEALVSDGGLILAGPGTNRTLTIVPRTNANGTAVITLFVRDGGGLTANAAFLLTVNPVNDLPTLSLSANQATSGSIPVSQPLAVADVESPAGSLVLTGTSSNPSLVPNGNITFTGSGGSRTVTVTASSNQIGTAIITVRLADADGGSVSNSFTVTVNPATFPPTITAQPQSQTVSNGATAVFSVTATGTAPLSYQWKFNSVNIAGATNPSLTLPNVQGANAGNYQVAVSNAYGLIASAPATLTVQSASLPSTLTLIATGAVWRYLDTGANLGTAWQGLTFSDAAWSSGPAKLGYGFGNEATVVGFGPDANNRYITTYFRRAFTVANPLLITNLLVRLWREDGAVVYLNSNEVFRSNMPGGAISFSTLAPFNCLSCGDELIAFPTNIAPSLLIAGTNVIAVEVHQAAVNSSDLNFDLELTATTAGTAAPPQLTIAPISNQTINEDTSLTIPFTVTDTDIPVFRLSLTATSTNATLVPTNNIFFDGSGTNRAVRIIPAANLSGTTRITITAGDGVTNASTAFQLTVNAVNDPPTLNAITNVALVRDFADTSVAFNGISSGAANESQTLSVSAVSSNTALITINSVSYAAGATNGTVRLTSPDKNGVGTGVVAVTVNDGVSTVTRSFTVFVWPTGNVMPTVSAIGNQVTAEDTPTPAIPFTVGDSVTPATLLTLSGLSSNTNLVPNANVVFGGSGSNRTVTVSPALNQSGSTAITIFVNDTNSGMANRTFLITVNPVNDLPGIVPPGPQTISEDAATGLLPFTVSDVETPAAFLAVTAASSNPTLIPNANIVLGGTGTNRALVITPLPNQSGAATITLTVSDGTGGTNSTNFLVNVTSVNDLPVISSISNQSLNQTGSTPPIPFLIGDLETPAASLTLSSSSSNPNLLPLAGIVFGGSGSNRTVTLTPSGAEAGSVVVILTVADANGGTAATSFSLTVLAVNRPPTLDPIDSLILNQNAPVQTVTLTGITRGASNELQHLAVSASSSNPGLIADPVVSYASTAATGTLSLVPTPGSNGFATITVTVNDGQSANNLFTRSFSVTVRAAPILSAIADQTIDEDGVTPALAFTVTDADTVATSLVVTAASSNPALIPTGNILLGGTDSNRTVTLQPLPNESGSALITLTVTDPSGLSSTASFGIVVNPVNDAPTLAPISNLTITEDAGLQTVTLTGITSGAPSENQTLTVFATSSNPTLIGNSTVIYSSPATAGSLTFAPLTNASGTATLRVVVSDGQSLNGSITQAFVVTVTAFNDLPTISDIPNTTTAEDVPVLVGFMVDDVETTAVSLPLSATSSDTNLVPVANIAFGGVGTSRSVLITPAADRFGSATLTITVTDGDGGSSSDSFLLTVSAVNDAPVISGIAEQVIDEDTATAALAFMVGDVETVATSLTLSATSSDTNLIPAANITFGGSGTNRTVVLRPATNQFGSGTVTISVSDGSTNVAMRPIALTVNPVNDPPTLNAFSNLSLAEDAGVQTVTLAGISTGSTNEVQTLTVTASSSNPALIPNPAVTYVSPAATGALSFTPVPNASGTATVSVVVYDGHAFNGSVTQLIVVTVTAVNDLPTISDIPDTTTAEDTPVLIGFIVGDVETPAASLTLSAASSNTNLVPVANIAFAGTGGSRAALITPAADLSGVTTITVTVTDSGGGTASDSFLLTVTSVNDFPVISDIPDQVTDEATPTPPVAFFVNDLAGAALLTLSASSSDPTLVPVSGIVFGGTGTDRTVTITPAANRSGRVTITVTATDTGAGPGTASDSFVLTVNPVNDAPTISDAADRIIDENTATGPIALLVGDVETPAANLNLSATSSNPNLVPNGAIALGGSGSNRTVVITPLPNRFGIALITLTVTDGDGANAIDTFVLTVNEVVHPPVIVSGPSNRSALPGATVHFSVAALGSDPLTYQWQRDGTDLAGATNSVLTLVNVQSADAGNYRARVANSAGNATSAAAALRLLVAPVITAIRKVGGAAEVSFTTSPGLSYTVEFKGSLNASSWSLLPPVSGTGGVMTVIDTGVSGQHRIYRVRAE